MNTGRDYFRGAGPGRGVLSSPSIGTGFHPTPLDLYLFPLEQGTEIVICQKEKDSHNPIKTHIHTPTLS